VVGGTLWLAVVNILVVDAFDETPDGWLVVHEVLATLEAGGHEITHRKLVNGPFENFMSAGERAAYHEAEPLITPETSQDAAAIEAADSMVFCYPTMLYTTPAVLKGWLERVLVPGVAFVFDGKGRVRPGMTQIRRLAAVTTTPHSTLDTIRKRDAGRRTTLRNLRLSCHPLCRTTFMRLDVTEPNTAKIRAKLQRW